jgi:hypothetical protein
MSSSERPQGSENASEEQPSKGPNLTLIYSLLGLAILLAIVIAALIVLPFYQRR